MIDFHLARKRMVKTQIVARGIRDPAVIRAMSTVPRHLFVEEALRERAYGDHPLPIGGGQTISQPYMVALMTEALRLSTEDRIMEIGTGSGYQTAILAEIGDRVVSIERVGSLIQRTRDLLDQLGYYRVVIRQADGTLGWKEEAPYDAIIVTAGAPEIPKKLVEQLVEGGGLVIPVGGETRQNLMRVTRSAEGDRTENLGGCIFVKLIGRYGWAVDS